MGPDGQVLIVGGGIGGLAAALALERRGIPSRVIEAREHPSEAGAGLQVGPNGTRILETLGIADALRELAGRPEAILVRDATTGAELARMPLGGWIASRHGAPYWTLHRADLHAALLARARSLGRITLDTGRAVDVADTGNGPAKVRLSNGTVLNGVAVVAADGLWSGIRTSSFGAAAPAPVGVSAARAVVRASAVAAGERTHVGLWLSATSHVVHYTVRGGAEIALVVVFPDAHGAGAAAWDTALPIDRIGALATRTAAPLQAILAAAPSWRVWDLHRVAPVPMARGRIALLGDAAHPIRPHLAQGAVMALEDAVVLASSIAAAPGDPDAALASYAALRRPRVERVAAASQQNGVIFHMQGVAAFARDTAMRMLGGERLMRRYDWLYGWRDD